MWEKINEKKTNGVCIFSICEKGKPNLKKVNKFKYNFYNCHVW